MTHLPLLLSIAAGDYINIEAGQVNWTKLDILARFGPPALVVRGCDIFRAAAISRAFDISDAMIRFNARICARSIILYSPLSYTPSEQGQSGPRARETVVRTSA
jgi:hypothetical protein